MMAWSFANNQGKIGLQPVTLRKAQPYGFSYPVPMAPIDLFISAQAAAMSFGESKSLFQEVLKGVSFVIDLLNVLQ